jgi:uncharacterized protein (TIGR02145 family)
MKKLICAYVFLIFIEALFVSCSTNGKTTALFNPNVTYGTLIDQDGNIYKTVTIGTQIWMAENLRTTKYNDGTSIPNVLDFHNWSSLSTGAYCNYNNTSNLDTIATYGRLYNGYAVITGKLASKGWHIATDAEWTTLTTYLGSEGIEADKLKERGVIHWHTSSINVTNETGFTALPSGRRGAFLDNFNSIEYAGYWWCAGEGESGSLWTRSMDNFSREVYRNYLDSHLGYSIRCVKD